MIEVRLDRKGDLQRGLRRLKKLMIREKIFDEVRKRRHFEKPSTRRREKQKTARFNAMLKQRHSDT